MTPLFSPTIYPGQLHRSAVIYDIEDVIESACCILHSHHVYAFFVIKDVWFYGETFFSGVGGFVATQTSHL